MDFSSFSGKTVFGNIIVPESERSNGGPFGALDPENINSSDTYASIVLKKFKKKSTF